MSVRIIYQDIAAGADDDALITAPAADFSEPSQIGRASCRERV